MKRFNHRIKWTLAAILIAGITAAPVMAEKTTPATGKNSAVPAVPRAIPDLLPYHKFDPPKSKLFDISKLTISGDLRVRPELRTNSQFGIKDDNRSFVQQWTRLGFNYSISPDVTFFFQAQHSKNWGRGGLDANGTDGTLYARQSFMLVRNFLVPNLTIKAGRQLVVWGNHRMFGHFDWNNVGWTHDGLTANYKLSKSTTLQVGWLRTAERNCAGFTSGVCIGGAGQCWRRGNGRWQHCLCAGAHEGCGRGPGTHLHLAGRRNGWRNNFADLVLRNQSRHTLGGRAVKKFAAGSARVDCHGGRLLPIRGNRHGRRSTEAGPRNMDIEAYAFHIDGGVTLPVPMQPRLSAEYNTASGDKDPAMITWSKLRSIVPHQPHPLRVHGQPVLEEHESSWRSASNCGPTRTATSK